ncbi:MAG: MFS transporter [Actinomycetaceae bacterium]|nr:MFS transporter [Actinomycetaceae bacterium]
MAATLTTNNPTEDAPIPDVEGHEKHARLAVIGGIISTFWTGALLFGYPGLMRPVWAERFHANPSELSWIMTFVVLSLGVSTFVAGKMHMRLGTRKSYLIGTAMLVVCMVLVIKANSVYVLYLWGFLNGFASSFFYSPSLTTVQHWYPHRRGLVTGLVNLMFGLSAAIMSPIFKIMFDSMGYEKMGWVLVVLIVITNAIAAAIAEMPNRANLTPAQLAAHEQLLANTKKNHANAPADDVEPSKAVRTSEFWFMWLTWSFMGAAGIAMVTLSTSYGGHLSEIGFAASGIAMLTAFNLTNGFSRILAGALSDIIGGNVLGSISFALAAVGYFLLPTQTNPIVLCVLTALVGFAFGTLFAITAPLGTDLFGLKNFPIIFGYIFTAYGFVGGLIGPLLSDFVLEKSGGSYGTVFGYLGVFCVLAAVFIMLAKPKSKVSK